MDIKDFSSADPALAEGTAHAGFTVTRVEAVPEIGGQAYVMRHDASGARLIWLACGDVNKSFAISFKTPPADDTGVFHILEHSVLCGSDAYPVKEPFVNLLKTSMQTFLNALTFSDKTMYPVASTNTADLENLMGVYLDAVLHPAIYNRPRIFEQEGWHLEVEGEGEGAKLAYNGVVFNEMKGALSDPDDVLYQALSRSLYPDTAYGFESGGNPRAIPTLTYEKFLETHARHYNLANSYTVLYGDLDIDRELVFIDGHFARACERDAGAPNPLEPQAPVEAAPARIQMATAENNAEVGVSYVVAEASQRERVLAIDVLLDALCGSNEAPLKRAILDAGLADDFDGALIDGILQPQAMFTLRGVKPGCAEKFRPLLESTCAELAENGIPRDKLAAALAQAEFNLREGDWGGYPDGVALSMVVMSSWLYDDERPLDYVHYEDALAYAKAGLDRGLYEQLLREIVCESKHSAEVELVPVEGGDAAEEEAELASIRAQMSDEELAAVAAEVEALRAEQEAPDAPEALACLPQLSVADIEDPAPEPAAPMVDAPLACIAHELDTHGIAYVYHYFDLHRLAADELPYVGVLSDLLGKLDTWAHTASDLDTLVETNLGGLGFFTEVFTAERLDYADPAFVVSASALSEKVERLADIPREVWSATRFDDLDDIRDILTQRKVALEQYFVSSGHSAAMSRAMTYYAAGSKVAGLMGGIDYYLFLRGLLAAWDERKEALAKKLGELCGRIFTADEVTVSFIGSAADRERFWAAAGDLGLPTLGEGAAHVLDVKPAGAMSEGFAIPSNVSYVVRASAPSALDGGTRGCWAVATRAVTYDYLWNEVRVKGGAYGTGFRHGAAGTRAFWSYRDPAIDGTLGRYDGCAPWLAEWDGTEEELTGYIVSTVAAHDAPVKPRALARRQDVARFNLLPEGRRDQVRAEELAVTRDDLRALAASLADAEPASSVCILGGRDALESCGLALAITELC
ncbi:insulinase family protein [Paratractidigestivibacter sp.]|uniref:insulinase family protein n=1 Tax=Paratractidigestivibacter sp. TaxID=2847316 RepID=UPI002AC96AB2|nr:insulinase family protein [Paratractidigestivibacter sp.]